jgi:FkbM family methyltransferase
MSSIPKYIQLIKHIRNWPVYFKRKHENGLTTRYVTNGTPLVFDVPPRFYEVFREIFMEDFYRINNLVKDMPDRPVVVDIGGNVGYFSFLLASKKKGARIFAFEPMHENVEVFNSNIGMNASLHNEVSLFNKAVTGNNNGSIDIFFDDLSKNSVVASVLNDFSVQNTEVKTVAAISLENIFIENELINIDLLKIDCEGSEYPIFYDSPGHIFEHVKMIAIESHDLDDADRNTAALCDFLRNKNFIVESFVAENKCSFIKAYRQ